MQPDEYIKNYIGSLVVENAVLRAQLDALNEKAKKADESNPDRP